MTEKREKILKNCLSNLEECAQLIEEYFPANEREPVLETLENLAKEYYKIEDRRELSQVALDLTTSYFNNDENDHTVNVNEIYKQNANNSVSHTVPMDQHPALKKVFAAIRNAAPKLDVSVECTQSFQIPIDPITKTEVQDPRRNIVCGHVYEHKVILEYIKSKKSKPAKCPYVGCPNANIQIQDLVEDEDLSLRMKNYTQNSTLGASTSIQEID